MRRALVICALVGAGCGRAGSDAGHSDAPGWNQDFAAPLDGGGPARDLAAPAGPSVASFGPSPLRVLAGRSATLTVTLDGPAPGGGTSVVIASADPSVVVADATLEVPAGATAADVVVNALAPGGPVAVSASTEGSAQSAQVLSIAPVARLVVSEVLYDAQGSDDGFEWVELWNGGHASIDLSGYFLGAAVSSSSPAYTAVSPALVGTLQPGDCEVVGGPLADPAANGLPVGFAYLDPVQFNPSLPNGTSVMKSSTAVALFEGDPGDVAGATMVDAVIYGVASRGLQDETGGTTRVDVGWVGSPGQSLERIGPSLWRVQATPTGGSCDPLHL